MLDNNYKKFIAQIHSTHTQSIRCANVSRHYMTATVIKGITTVHASLLIKFMNCLNF